MKFLRIGCLTGFLAFVLLLLFAIVIEPTYVAIRERMAIGDVLRRAKSIEMVHFNPGFAGDREIFVYQRKSLPPADYRRFAKAVPWMLDLGLWGTMKMCIFNPHHKLLVTDANGVATSISVCFECDQIKVGNSPSISTPYAWRGRLRAFFANEGMPDKASVEYWHDFNDYLSKHANPSPH